MPDIGDFSIEDIRNAVKEAISDGDFVETLSGKVGDILGKDDVLEGVLGTSGSLKQLFKLIGKILGDLVAAFEHGFANDSAQEAFWNAVKSLVDKLFELLTDLKSRSLEAFPSALGTGVTDALQRMMDSARLLKSYGRYHDVEIRLKAVEASVQTLFKLLDGGGTGPGTLLAGVFGSVLSGLRDVMEAGCKTEEPGCKIEEIVFDLLCKIVYPKDVVLTILDALINKKMLGWTFLPNGLFGGQLNQWLNDPEYYPTLGGSSPEDEKLFRDAQRDFRIRLIAVADSYLRRQIGEDKSPLSLADERMTAQSIADVIIIFMENVIGFVLEVQCHPQLDVDWDGFEDIGFQYAAILAKQARLMIRNTVGLVLRGVWEYSLHSDTLVEMVATTLGAVASAFVEAYVKNLAFTFQIVSCYQGAAVEDGAMIPNELRWRSLETIEDTGADCDQLEYVAMVRTPGGHTPDVPPALIPVIKDMGAYIDVTYRQARVESKFLERDFEERVVITRSELRQVSDNAAGSSRLELTIWASTSEAFQRPQPVLRAYVCCEILAMRPGPSPGDPYTINVFLDKVPRCLDVFVLSNRGGLARRKLAIF